MNSVNNITLVSLIDIINARLPFSIFLKLTLFVRTNSSAFSEMIRQDKNFRGGIAW